MREIKVNKNYEDIKIGEGVYKVDLSYGSFRRCKSELSAIAEVLKTPADDSDERLTPVDNSDERLMNLSQTFINTIFADEPFEDILGECNGDIFIILEVMTEVVKMIEEKARGISKNMKVANKFR